MAISLSSLRRGRPDEVPLRMVLAGTPGVGKTTFACSAPSPVVIQTEDGLEPLIHAGIVPDTIARFPMAQSYTEVMDALAALYQEEHDFRTLVLDSLDWLEPLVWAKTCQDHNKSSIEEFGYGKGYLEADRYWASLRDGFNALRARRGMNILLVAHTEVRKFETPDTSAYDRYLIKIHKRAHALWEEWADIVGTAIQVPLISTETVGSGKLAKKRSRAVGTMDRVLYLGERPSAVAKNRFGLPSELPLSWAAFEEALHGNQPATQAAD